MTTNDEPDQSAFKIEQARKAFTGSHVMEGTFTSLRVGSKFRRERERERKREREREKKAEEQKRRDGRGRGNGGSRRRRVAQVKEEETREGRGGEERVQEVLRRTTNSHSCAFLFFSR